MREKIVLIILSALLIIVLFNGSALGELANYRCVIDQVGIGADGAIRARLTELNGQFNQKWFRSETNNTKQILAILLTASANNMIVRLRTDLQQGPEPEIRSLYILP